MHVWEWQCSLCLNVQIVNFFLFFSVIHASISVEKVVCDGVFFFRSPVKWSKKRDISFKKEYFLNAKKWCKANRVCRAIMMTTTSTLSFVVDDDIEAMRLHQMHTHTTHTDLVLLSRFNGVQFTGGFGIVRTAENRMKNCFCQMSWWRSFLLLFYQREWQQTRIENRKIQGNG